MNIWQIIQQWWFRLLISNCLKTRPRRAAENRQLVADQWPAKARYYYLKTDGKLADVYQVGSPLYVAMLRRSSLTARQQLSLIVELHLQAVIDEDGFLQLHGSRFQLAAELSPASFFLTYFRQLIIDTYPTPLGLRQDQLGHKIHLFRVYLDRQMIDFIRHYPADKGASDYDRLLKYCADHQMELDYQTGANYHNRFHGSFRYPQNMKVQLRRDSTKKRFNDARMVEFIVNITSGQFISQWNVYRVGPTGVDANPEHYSTDDFYQIANTESFNYGLPKGVYRIPPTYRGTHRYLDIKQPANSRLRRAAQDYWQYPHDYDHGGRFAELVKDGGKADVYSWRSVPVSHRQAVYDGFVADLQREAAIMALQPI